MYCPTKIASAFFTAWTHQTGTIRKLNTPLIRYMISSHSQSDRTVASTLNNGKDYRRVIAFSELFITCNSSHVINHNLKNPKTTLNTYMQKHQIKWSKEKKRTYNTKLLSALHSNFQIISLTHGEISVRKTRITLASVLEISDLRQLQRVLTDRDVGSRVQAILVNAGNKFWKKYIKRD